MVLVLSLSIAYMFLSINMQENKNPPAVNITNNVGTIDQSHYELIIVATLWMRILNGIWMKDLISRCIVWMKSPVVKGKFIIQKMAADGMNIMIK